MSLSVWLWVALWGVAGCFIRLALTRYAGLLVFGMPAPTILANALGCFALGYLTTSNPLTTVLGPAMRMALAVGFCGALTTFSGWILDMYLLISEGFIMRFFIYMQVSLLSGFLLFLLGRFLGMGSSV